MRSYRRISEMQGEFAMCGTNRMRQLIVVRKDLDMSPGKLAAQVSHASMAFLVVQIRRNAEKAWKYETLPTMEEDFFTGEKRPRWFRRTDLGMFAEQARSEGKDSFSYRPVDPERPHGILERCENEYDMYAVELEMPRDVYEDWICGIFTKTICAAKNRNQLLKTAAIAEDLGLEEGKDFFFIKDNCSTELEPAEVDENGIGKVLTCIGFRPLPDVIAHQISRKYQLYK